MPLHCRTETTPGRVFLAIFDVPVLASVPAIEAAIDSGAGYGLEWNEPPLAANFDRVLRELRGHSGVDDVIFDPNDPYQLDVVLHDDVDANAVCESMADAVLTIIDAP
jgi:hypothetical protein